VDRETAVKLRRLVRDVEARHGEHSSAEMDALAGAVRDLCRAIDAAAEVGKDVLKALADYQKLQVWDPESALVKLDSADRLVTKMAGALRKDEV
jgi:hypothetical protein